MTTRKQACLGLQDMLASKIKPEPGKHVFAGRKNNSLSTPALQ
jgi:hypothetical protein